MVNQVFQQSKDWVLKNKLATFLAVALFAMVITTIALAVSNNSNADDLDVCRAAVDAIERGSTTLPPADTTLTDENTASQAETTTVSMDTSPITTLEPTTTITTTTVVDGNTGVNYRLPGDNIPQHYDLQLHPNLETGKFSGRTTITIRTVHATDRIVLHSALLDIGRVQFKSLNDSSLVMRTQTTDTSRDFLIVELMRELQPTHLSELTIEFTGDLVGPNVGFYSSSYPTDDGGKITIATSKFEPTFARQAFPCFDEPQLKAEYTIELVHPSGDGYHALSNMNALETVANNPSVGLSTTKFARSVPMSTYLVVFIVSDFVSDSLLITPPTNLGQQFELSVFATRYQQANAAYALTTAATVIRHYIEYFGIEYPLPKLDMAAIPDFVSGAMETWGLVTYRETSILYNSQTSSTANKQRVASVIAHELAHMWFGNLVTMKWWNELWLNEGFASYIEYKGIHAAHPEWDVMEQFVIDDLHGVLNLDATLASHPIVVSVENPNQITEIFDTITYSKGASVIRMLEDFVSEPIFRQGVRQYLEKLKFENGVSEDLMEELDQLYTDVSVSEVMNTFTKQKGFPVITVERRTQQYVLRQSRFLADASAEETEESPFGYRWYIPITYITSDNPDTVQRVWFPPTEQAITIAVSSGGNHWFKFNRNQVGYYRVNYPLDMWQEFSNALQGNVDVFSIGDRTGLLSDVFALADASTIEYSMALELTRYLQNERQYVPWSTAASKLKSVRNLLFNFNSFDDLTKYIQDLVSGVVTDLGWVVNEQEHMKNLLRTTTLDLACSVGHAACLEQAGNFFRSWLNDNVAVHPDIRSIVYTFGIQATGITVADWEKVLERYKSEIDANEKTKLMVALASYPDQRVMRRFLDISWDDNVIRQQDQISCVQYIAGNRHGEQAAWEHVRENWDRFVDRFTLNERNLGRMIPSITGRFSTTARLMELQDFFARNPEAGAGESARRQAIENIQNNISWLQRNEVNVAKWLQEVLAPPSP